MCLDGECKIYNNIQGRYIRYKLMWYIARYMLRWYVLILIAITNCCTKKCDTIFSAYACDKATPYRYNNLQSNSKEEGRTSNMITTANCIEEIWYILWYTVKICLLEWREHMLVSWLVPAIKLYSIINLIHIYIYSILLLTNLSAFVVESTSKRTRQFLLRIRSSAGHL